METCLSFSRSENAYDDAPFGRPITKEEALTILDEAEKEGLVHCTYNVENQNMFVCNCCSCCCGFLRGVKEFEAPHLLVHSNSVAVIDEDDCIVCGVCADERCPMEAISEGDDSYQVKQGICIGCGVCILECPTDAITMVPRPEDERNQPSKNLLDWSVKRRKNQIGPIRSMAQFAGLSLAAARARKDTRE